MNKTYLLIFFLMLLTSLNAQTLKKYAISNSGCSYYSYCEAKWELSYSQDSSRVFTGECLNDGFYYSVICVKLAEAVSDLSAAELMMISYLDYLKTSFEITSAAGYGKGHRLQNNENTRGVLDYWSDKVKNNWKVKGWTNGKFIGIMMVYSQKELPETKINVFLDSFRLP
ncbi:MAG: hypothetical protein IPH18_01095 [Chitinophagaceae bacterium]|nr:hypothetical protein [Chitinophagaceae bacterium]MBK8952972.1 hypothetical protein [Chitinophagaceae bacterium]